MDILSIIRKAAKQAGSQSALAKQLGVSEPYLSDVLNERRDPGESILTPLGYERVTVYRRLKPPSEPQPN